MIRSPKHMTSFLLPDSPYCPLGLPALVKEAAMWESSMWQGREALIAIACKKLNPGS